MMSACGFSRKSGSVLASLALCTPLVAAAGSSAAAQALFESRRLTPPGEYTKHIEGPAVDASGNLYVMNFGREDGTIGKVKPGATRSAPFATLPPKSIGNGARFDRDGRMYVADFNNHIVFVIARGQNDPQPYFTSPKFNQPNDLAIAADGTLYASDPKGRTGQVWRIRRRPDGAAQGEVMSSERTLHKTNGIDLSPAGDTLYVGEPIRARSGPTGSRARSSSPRDWSSASTTTTSTGCAPMSTEGSM
jgi:hypothetical protein